MGWLHDDREVYKDFEAELRHEAKQTEDPHLKATLHDAAVCLEESDDRIAELWDRVRRLEEDKVQDLTRKLEEERNK